MKWFTREVSCGVLVGIGFGIIVARVIQSAGVDLGSPLAQILSLALIALGGAAARLAHRATVNARGQS